MVKGQRFVLKHQFNGLPKKEDFDLIEEDLPPLKGIYSSSFRRPTLLASPTPNFGI